MLNQPRKTKFKKYHKGRLGSALCGLKSKGLELGCYGLQAKEGGYVKVRQLEAARQTISRHLQRRGKIWIKIFPDWAITSKPTESRIGKGKGKVAHWVCRVRPGKIILEVSGVSWSQVSKALNSASHKLPIALYLHQN